MWTIFKVFEFVTVLLLFLFWFFGHEACGILAPQPGTDPAPPALEGEVPTTGPPGKSRPHFVLKQNLAWLSQGEADKPGRKQLSASFMDPAGELLHTCREAGRIHFLIPTILTGSPLCIGHCAGYCESLKKKKEKG